MRIGPLLTKSRFVALLFLVALVAAGALGGKWLLRSYRASWCIAEGRRAFANMTARDELPRALAAWEARTRAYWQDDPDPLIQKLYKGLDPNRPDDFDLRRTLLECVSGANYGARRDDWDRWYKARQALAAGRQPEVKRREERVALGLQWETPVGLTAWFTNILVLDGQVYVGALGSTQDPVDDLYDGIVRVDGRSGQALLLFTPPDKPPRDVLGLALGDNVLIAACRNGYVYAVDREGRLVWRHQAGARLVSGVVTLDATGDGVADAAVVTDRGKVVLINGKTGNSEWTASLPGGEAGMPGTKSLVHASLAAVPFGGAGTPALVIASETGAVCVLNARRGDVLWKGAVAAGTYAPPLTFSNAADKQAVAMLIDGEAQVWALTRSGARLELKWLWSLALGSDETAVAGLRTLDNGPELPPWTLACTLRGDGPLGGTVCAVGPQGVQWRCAPGGMIWGTPAVADLNRDGRSEIVVTSFVADAGKPEAGFVTVLSCEGQFLWQSRLPAPIKCAPVIADVTGTERLELLVADTGGMLHCYSVPGRRGAVEWGLYGGDPHNTRNAGNAYDWGQRPATNPARPETDQWKWRPRW